MNVINMARVENQYFRGFKTLKRCQNVTFYNDILTFNTHDENEKDVEMGCDQQYAWLIVKINIKPLLLSAYDCRIDIPRWCDNI